MIPWAVSLSKAFCAACNLEYEVEVAGSPPLVSSKASVTACRYTSDRLVRSGFGGLFDHLGGGMILPHLGCLTASLGGFAGCLVHVHTGCFTQRRRRWPPGGLW